MVFKEKEFKLKDGREALLRSPCEDDAKEMLQFIIKASGETDFLMKFPEEFAEFTLEQEKDFIREDYCNQNGMMISCLVNGKITGNCQISFRIGMKDRHRASVAIALLQEFWNLAFVRLNWILSKATAGQGVCTKKWDFALQGQSQMLYE